MIPPISLGEPVGSPGATLLVLGPSLGTSTDVWDEVSRVLQTRFRVAAWDLPGHGNADAAVTAFSVGDLADAVVEALDTIGEQRVAYAGVSLGAAVGLELAVRHSERLHALSAVCSGAVIGTPAGWRERAISVRRDGTGSMVEGSASRWFAPVSRSRLPEVTSRLLEELGGVDDESYALCCDALAEYDVREELTDVRLPVQAVWAEHDVVTPEPSLRDIVERVVDGELCEVRGAGHLAPAEQPDEVAALIGSFLAPKAVAA